MATMTKREILKRKRSEHESAKILPRPTFKDTCQRHGLSGSELARMSGVSLRVVYNMFSPGSEQAQIGTTLLTANKLARALSRKADNLTTKQAWSLLWEYEDSETIRDIADSLRAYAETLHAMSRPHVAAALDQLAHALVSGELPAITPVENYASELAARQREADQITSSEADTSEKVRAMRALGLTFEEIGMRLGFTRAYAHELASQQA